MNRSETIPPRLKPKRKTPSLWFWISAGSVAASFFIGLVLLVFVLPVFAEMFADFGAELPRATQLVINLSAFTKSYFLLLLSSVMGITALLIWALYALDKRGRIIAIFVIGNIPPVLVIVMLIPMFLPIFRLSSVLSGS